MQTVTFSLALDIDIRVFLSHLAPALGSSGMVSHTIDTDANTRVVTVISEYDSAAILAWRDEIVEQIPTLS